MAKTTGDAAGKLFFKALVFSGIIAFADQLAKSAIISSKANLPIQLLPGLQIIYAENTGIAFGLFQGNNSLFLMVGLIVAIIVLLGWKQFKSTLEKYAAVVILGGTLGNLFDRIFRDAVVDYFSFLGFPAFNIADAALTIGAGLLIAGFIKDMIAKSKKK